MTLDGSSLMRVPKQRGVVVAHPLSSHAFPLPGVPWYTERYFRSLSLLHARRLWKTLHGFDRGAYGTPSHLLPLLSKYGTYKTVKARFWPWLLGDRPLNP